jgi:hypothetical protein
MACVFFSYFGVCGNAEVASAVYCVYCVLMALLLLRSLRERRSRMGALAFVAVKHGLAMFIRSYVTCAACLQVSPVSVSLGGLPILTCSWKLGCSCAGVAGHKLGACALPSAWTGVRHFSYFGVCGNAGVASGCVGCASCLVPS